MKLLLLCSFGELCATASSLLTDNKVKQTDVNAVLKQLTAS